MSTKARENIDGASSRLPDRLLSAGKRTATSATRKGRIAPIAEDQHWGAKWRFQRKADFSMTQGDDVAGREKTPALLADIT